MWVPRDATLQTAGAFRREEAREAADLETAGDQTWAFDIVLMPEGKRDMETIPSKKSEVNPIPLKNFDLQHI
jgi:hypothetical protein